MKEQMTHLGTMDRQKGFLSLQSALTPNTQQK